MIWNQRVGRRIDRPSRGAGLAARKVRRQPDHDGEAAIATGRVRFGRFQWAPGSPLLEAGCEVELGARAASLLAVLIAERHRVVDKHELLARAWPGLVVAEGNLHTQVSNLRALLGSDAIATVPGRGYRFTAAVIDEPLQGELALTLQPVEPHEASLSSSAATSRHVHFGSCELRLDERVLLIDGQSVKVGARAFDVLVALIERRGRVVTKRDLLEVVWPHAVVEEGNLQAQVSNLRKLLGGGVLRTVPGKGYSFIAPLRGDDGTPARAAAETRGVSSERPPANAWANNLPEVLPELLGRGDDLAALGALVAKHRLISVVAAGGIGKSRLVQHLLQARRDAHTHGACLIELAGVGDAALVAGTLANALGLRSSGGDPLPGLVAALRPLDILIALDNAEHLIDEVARVVQAITEGAPRVRIVVTSQTPLKLATERVYRLAALGVPELPMSVQEALTFSAVALFNARASAADRHFKLDEDTLPEVVEICRHLDGMALAIELAAARVPTLGVRKLAGSLGQRLKILTGGFRPAIPRHRTLRAALDWSHSLLSGPERAAFRRLAVFAGSFSLEMAEQVISLRSSEWDADEWAVLDTLGSLVDRSLVNVDEAGPGQELRYRLLETPRAYAAEQLANDADEAYLARQRHARAVLKRLQAVDDALWSGRAPVDESLPAFELDIDNARAALGWFVDHDPSGALRLVSALEHGMRLNRWPEYARWWGLTEPLLSGPVEAGAAARWRLSFARCWGDIEPTRAMTHALAAAEHFDQAGDDRSWYLAMAAYVGASACSDDGSIPLPELERMRAREDPRWPAYVRLHGERVALLPAFRQGDFEASKANTERFVSLARSSGARLRALGAQANLADLALALGHVDDSIRGSLAALAQCSPGKDNYWLVQIWNNLFDAHVAQGDFTAARAAAAQAWPLSVEVDRIHWWLDTAAHLAAREGRPRHAMRLIGASDARYAVLRVFRQRNGTRCIGSAERIAREHLSEALMARLKADGAALPVDQLLVVGLSASDD